VISPADHSRPEWQSAARTLLRGGRVYSPSDPFATALLIDDGIITWVGDDAGANVHAELADLTIDLGGALVTPGFVDAHVHATATGIMLTGLNLADCTSAADVLARVDQVARETRGRAIIGHGWDETNWDDTRLPTRQELDRAAWGGVVYLSRVDVHSALVSSALVTMIRSAETLSGWDSVGAVSRDSHGALRTAALGSIDRVTRRTAQETFRTHCATHGIVAVHEMGGPTISSSNDLTDLLVLAQNSRGPLVTGYWGELAQSGGIEAARDMGAWAVGGDLFIDGAVGSRTACLHSPYTDQPDTSGADYMSSEDVAQHVQLAIEAGMQAGFHVIGDRGSSLIMQGIADVVEHFGVARVREAGHRLEHAEMMSDADIHLLAAIGGTASVQPVFDALWAGGGGMYEARLGADRAAQMNRFAGMSKAGVLVAFGSDAPVTEVSPWQAIRAAAWHHTVDQRMSVRAAFAAHSRAGWRAVGLPHVGTIDPGAPAHLAIWETGELDVQSPDPRLSAWSTDPRSGTPELPIITETGELPRCLATLVHGTPIFSAGALDIAADLV
jgi:predicted amidohydrolase YtcJ